VKYIFLVLIMLSSSAYAKDDGLAETPGSVWYSVGTSPVESDNIVNSFHVGQGIVVGHVKTIEVIPFVAVNAANDSKGYPWNNKIELEGGVKLNKNFNNGYVDIGLAYGTERLYNYASNVSNSSLMLTTSGWFGYQAMAKYKTPGTVMWVLGNTSPSDSYNTVGQVRLEQGVTVANVKQANIDVLAWGQLGFDTQNRSWNNRTAQGLGVKVVLPFTDGSVTLTGGYECVKSYSDGIENCGPVVKLDIWAGWKSLKGGK